jgi:hypothetical protein
VLELAMAFAGCDQNPSVIREQPKNLADLHIEDYAPGGGVDSIAP